MIDIVQGEALFPTFIDDTPEHIFVIVDHILKTGFFIEYAIGEHKGEEFCINTVIGKA